MQTGIQDKMADTSWAFQFGLLIVAFFNVVVIEPLALYWLLTKTTNQKIQLAILGLALLPGYFVLTNTLVMNFGGFGIILCSLLFIGPVAALIPPLVYPGLISPGSRFRRFFSTYIFVILFNIILLFGFLQSGHEITFHRIFYNPSLISITAIYSGLVVLDTLVAFAAYRLIQKLYPIHPVPKSPRCNSPIGHVFYRKAPAVAGPAQGRGLE